MAVEIKNRLNIRQIFTYKLSTLKGIPIEVDLKPYIPVLEEVRRIQGNLKERTNEWLATRGSILRQQACEGEALNELLPEVFAILCVLCFRCLGLEPFDEQIIAGVAIGQGKLVQMQTGEGKTLAAVLPACLNALSGRPVHVMTANDYLAKRDAEWMGPLYRYFGLEVAYVNPKMLLEERRSAYNAGITYLTAREAGFDFLRDQLVYEPADVLQRPFHMAIIDEADFLLIDEGRIPLVIAGDQEQAALDPYHIDRIVGELIHRRDYDTDKNKRRIFLTLEGQMKIQNLLGCGGIHEESSVQMYEAVNVALHARYLLVRDVDYLLRDGKIELIDEFTGRIAERRRWPYGIQTALEAKEQLNLQPSGEIYGSITIQHFINLYPHLAAMTATAVSAAGEFHEFFALDTVIIPPHESFRRIDAPDRIFRFTVAKTRAILREIRTEHATGRPILVGTTSVKESKALADLLQQEGISCEVLNAENDALEAELIARAGLPGAVTISTNMAGRGTDIQLGGVEGVEKEKLCALGGLYVIGTNRHESVRIDNQLRGRAGRQGDPGLTRFFLSLEDDLFQRFGIREFIPREFLEGESAAEFCDKRVVKEVVRAQEIIEGQNYEIRRTLRKYSALVEKQRAYLQLLRRQALFKTELPETLREQCAQRCMAWQSKCGREVGEKILSRVFLYYLDRFWQNHLAGVEELREGIHLRRMAGREPLLEFIRDLSAMFSEGLLQVEQQTLKKFHELEILANGVDFNALGLKGPSSTWTYLINDNPFPSFTVSMFATNNIGFSVGRAAFLPWIALVKASVWLGNRIKEWISNLRQKGKG